jgi:hypothetical protein
MNNHLKMHFGNIAQLCQKSWKDKENTTKDKKIRKKKNTKNKILN